jgi:hypothetical protein
LFPPQTVSKGLPSVDTAAAQPPGYQKTNAPPGLDSHGPAGGKNNRGQGRGGKQDNHQQLQALQQQQQALLQQPYGNYGQPPGMPVNNGRAGQPSLPGMPYAGYPGFDVSQQQYLNPPYVPAAGSAAPTSSAAATGTTSTTTSTTSNAQAPTNQQQPAAYPPPPGMASPYGFYPTPYAYPGQYFYGQPNVQNYYNQGRNMYQPPRGPYAGDPYAQGALYPELNYGGQFGGDMMQQMGGPNSTGAQSNKQAKGGIGAPGSAASAQSEQAPGYGYYNQRGWDQNQAAGYQNPSAGWGMMGGAPGIGGQPGLPAGGLQQVSAPQASSQQQGARDGNQQRSAPFGNRGGAPGAGTWGI